MIKKINTILAPNISRDVTPGFFVDIFTKKI